MGSHGGAAQLGLSDVQVKRRAYVNEVPGRATQEVVDVVASIDDAAPGDILLAAGAPGGGRMVGVTSSANFDLGA